MCLSRPGYLKTAEEDIVVYKHIILEDEYITSYRHAPVKFNILTSSILIKDNESNTVDFGLHSFINKEDALSEARRFGEILVRCIIPKGSEYYQGEFETRGIIYPSYASDYIVYDEILRVF